MGDFVWSWGRALAPATGLHLVSPRVAGRVDTLRDSHPLRHLAPQ